MTKGLTDRQIKSARPRETQYEIWDQKVPAFGVRVSPSGAKSFQVLYRIRRRSRRLTLGRYPALSLSEARRRALEALGRVALGKDPADEKAQHSRNPLEFSTFVTFFIQRYAKPKNRRWRETERLLKHHFVKKWRNQDIREIRKGDVLSVIDNIMTQGTPIAANRTLAAVRRLFNWAIERGVIDISPCAGLRSPGRAVSRDRTLSAEELAKVWRGAGAMGYPFGYVVLLLILTGQRLQEVTSMRFDQINIEKAVWSIPASENKSKRQHNVPLSREAIGIIGFIPRMSSDLLFPARGKSNPISGFSKWKRTLDELSGVQDWTLHDLRRTVATGMAALQIAPHVVERVLNHKSGTFSGVAGIYNRFAYLEEMRDALQKWSQEVVEYEQEGTLDGTLSPGPLSDHHVTRQYSGKLCRAKASHGANG